MNVSSASSGRSRNGRRRNLNALKSCLTTAVEISAVVTTECHDTALVVTPAHGNLDARDAFQGA